MTTFYTNDILERMKKVYGVHSNKDIASLFSLKETAISNWKSRNSIPFEILLRCVTEKGVTLDWLAFGKESTALATDEKMALLAFNDLDDRQKMEAIAMMSNLKNGSTNALQSINGDGNTLAGRDVNIKSTN